MSTGLEFFAAVLDRGVTVPQYLRLGNISHLFLHDEHTVYDFVQAHLHEFGVMPQRDTLVKRFGIELPKAEEPHTYYLKHLRSRYIAQNLTDLLNRAGPYMKGSSKNPEQALELILRGALELRRTHSSSEVYDFRDAYDPVLTAYREMQRAYPSEGIKLGWPYLDDMTGGIGPGDLVSIVGRPQRGKTWQMLHSARQVWMTQRTVLFVSMEMRPLVIQQRLASMEAGSPVRELQRGELGFRAETHLQNSLLTLRSRGTPFWIVDGNLTVTIPELLRYCRQLAPQAVYVDGAYLLLTGNSRQTRWERVSEVCENLKQRVSSDLEVPVIASWQFNRESSASQRGAGLEHIAFSDVIGQLSSVVLALFDEDGPDRQPIKRVEVLKGRSGETGSFRTRWDFRHMDFSQVDEGEGLDVTLEESYPSDGSDLAPGLSPGAG